MRVQIIIQYDDYNVEVERSMDEQITWDGRRSFTSNTKRIKFLDEAMDRAKAAAGLTATQGDTT